MSTLSAWADKLFAAVEQDGTRCTRIRLTTGEQTWQIWDQVTRNDKPSFGNPEHWAAEAEGLLSELAKEWPARPIQVQFIAEDQNGATYAVLPKTVRGSNRDVKSIGMGQEQKSLAEAMSTQAQTMSRLLDNAMTQADVFARANVRHVEDSIAYQDLIATMRAEAIQEQEARAKARVESAQTIARIGNTFADHLPLLFDLAKDYLANKGAGTSRAMSEAAKSAALQVGASVAKQALTGGNPINGHSKKDELS